MLLPKIRRAQQRLSLYTVMHGKTGPEFRVVMGRLKETGERFIANTLSERDVLDDLQQHDSLGRPGIVRAQGGGTSSSP